jgi:hypothetical protein
MVQALVPVFVLIMFRHVFRRLNFPGGDFWPQAERFPRCGTLLRMTTNPPPTSSGFE